MSLANRLRPWGPALLWAGVLFLLSALPSLGRGLGIPMGDKLAHAGLYAVLGVLLANGWARSPASVGHLTLLLIGALYGVTDELHQMYVPGRAPDALDWAADVVGVLLGYGVTLALLGRKKKRESEGSN